VTVLAVSFAAGAAVSALLWRVLAPVFEHPVLARTNLHGRRVATAGGLVLVLAVLVPAVAPPLVVWANRDVPGWLPPEAFAGWSTMLVAVLGFGLLGFVDDLLGDGSSRGFGGHLAALRSGVLTTGSLKLVGGGVVAVYLALGAAVISESRWQLIVDAALIALAANLANLFDRAPGRVTKVAILVAIPLVIATPATFDQAGGRFAHPPVATVFVVGAAVGLLVPELRERLMLGDTGANAIGASLGVAAVMGLSPDARTGIAITLLVLNLASERVSFSRVIAATPGLRHLDELGRRTD
jgi:UDP-GlcNAc:undecaprenyl-phosphate/decaprenyl-phosphate GlcNAc-1-phosphate transferase